MESQGLHLLSTLAQIGIASILLVLLLLYYKKNFGQAETDVPLENLDLERPPVVGFAYDHEAKAEEPAGAEILALFSLHNSELIDEGDVIVEYRGHVVRSGSELDQLIDQLDDVSDGDVVEMKVLRKDRADPEIG